MWHIELEYDDFIVIFNRDSLDIDDDNNIYMAVTAPLQQVFHSGLHVEAIQHHVNVPSLRLVPTQVYTTPNTIPQIQERDVCNVVTCGKYIIQLTLT